MAWYNILDQQDLDDHLAAADPHPQYALDADSVRRVRATYVVALPANTRTADVLEANANGVLTNADGVTLAVDDEVIVPWETVGANRGVYVVTDLGSASTHWKLTRRSGFSNGLAVALGAPFMVAEGVTMAGVVLSVTSAVAAINTNSWTFTAPRGHLLNLTRFNASGSNSLTYHKFTRSLKLRGGGAGGGGYYALSAGGQSGNGGGGAAGQIIDFWVPDILDPSNSYMVGAKGTGGVSSGPTAPTVGADSTLIFVDAGGSHTITVKGGPVGAVLTSGTAFGQAAGGAPSTAGTGEGTYQIRKTNGSCGGYGLRFNGSNAFGGDGGMSPEGAEGTGGPIAGGPGGAATGHCAGGGGASSVGGAANNGGDGADGFWEIWEYT